MNDKYLSEIKSEDLIGRYMFPSEGRAEIFIEFKHSEFYSIEDSNLVQLAYGKFELCYNKSKHAILFNFENLGNAKLDFIFEHGFRLKFNDECLKKGIPNRVYDFWDVNWKSFKKNS